MTRFGMHFACASATLVMLTRAVEWSAASATGAGVAVANFLRD